MQRITVGYYRITVSNLDDDTANFILKCFAVITIEVVLIYLAVLIFQLLKTAYYNKKAEKIFLEMQNELKNENKVNSLKIKMKYLINHERQVYQYEDCVDNIGCNRSKNYLFKAFVRKLFKEINNDTVSLLKNIQSIFEGNNYIDIIEEKVQTNDFDKDNQENTKIMKRKNKNNKEILKSENISKTENTFIDSGINKSQNHKTVSYDQIYSTFKNINKDIQNHYMNGKKPSIEIRTLINFESNLSEFINLLKNLIRKTKIKDEDQNKIKSFIASINSAESVWVNYKYLGLICIQKRECDILTAFIIIRKALFDFTEALIIIFKNNSLDDDSEEINHKKDDEVENTSNEVHSTSSNN